MHSKTEKEVLLTCEWTNETVLVVQGENILISDHYEIHMAIIYIIRILPCTK